MVKYILRRLAISLVTIWVIATASFFLLRLLPGNPFTSSQILPADVVDQLMDYYGLNRPIMEQYATFMWNLLHFDFGYSLKYAGQSVNGIIAETFPVSAQLGLHIFCRCRWESCSASSLPTNVENRWTICWSALRYWGYRYRSSSLHRFCSMSSRSSCNGCRSHNGRALHTPYCRP